MHAITTIQALNAHNAEAAKAAREELEAAQEAVHKDPSAENLQRYARAIRAYDRLH